MTAICVKPGCSSAATNVRPSSGGVPSSVKKLGRDGDRVDAIGTVAASDVGVEPLNLRDLRRRLRQTPIVEKLGRRDERDLRVRRPVVDDDDLIRIRVWRRTQQHGADDAEHRGVESDADRQRERGDDREAAIAQQGARADARVHPGLLEKLAHARMCERSAHPPKPTSCKEIGLRGDDWSLG